MQQTPQKEKSMNQTEDFELNPIGLDGMEFVEYASPNPEALAKLFLTLQNQF